MKSLNFFISYRHQDLLAQGSVGRIYEHLSKRYGKDKIFLDDYIPPGDNFRQVLLDRVNQSDVLMIVIGPEWGKLWKPVDEPSEDYVLTEIETALAGNKRIVPILLPGASSPKEDDLPPAIRSLCLQQCRKLDTGREFKGQLDRLADELDGGMKHKYGLIVAVVVAVLAFLVIGTVVYRNQHPPPSLTELSVLIIMGENVPYEREIEEGFTDRLRTALSQRGVKLTRPLPVVPHFTAGYASPYSKEGRQAWADVIQGIRKDYAPRSIDFFVCLGTFASVAVRDSGLVGDFRAKGLIYLGVTDPIKAELVHKYKIAGVRYGTGGEDWGRKIAELFPDQQKLVYVYDGKLPQDESMAQDLERLNQKIAASSPAARNPRFEIRLINNLIGIEDLKKADPEHPLDSEIYFAWYGLDNILSMESISSLSDPLLWYIPATYSPKFLRNAGLVVSVSDKMVGELGADIILKYIDHSGLSLEDEPVYTPGFSVWINRETIERKGMQLVPEAYRRQDDPSYTYED